MFIFEAPKHIALKTVIENNYALEKTFYQRLQTSISDWSYKKFEKWRKNIKKIGTFWARKLLKMTF